MRTLRWLYHPRYALGSPLPLRRLAGIPLDKARCIRRELITQHGVRPEAFEGAPAARDADLARAHTRRLLTALEHPREVAATMEMAWLAWLPAPLVHHLVVSPQLRAAGGTIAALLTAADGGWAFNLGGGFHHAGPARSHGYCLVNDLAVAVHAARALGREPRVLVMDLDLHQGDGNAAAFAGDPAVRTVSLHQADIFPEPKACSDLDVPLPAGVGDDGYLAALDGALAEADRTFAADVVAYVAGADPYAGDPKSGLGLSRAALLERDRRVARFARDRGCGLVVVAAGGYAPESPAITAAGYAAMAAIGCPAPRWSPS